MKRFLISINLILFMIPIHAQTAACKTEKEKIFSSEFGLSFQTEFNAYKPDESILKQIDFEDVRVMVVLGIWCEDSQREVPRFLKIAENTLMNGVKAEYHLVDREKFCPDPAIQELKAAYVPSFIFFKNGRELGRIVESPGKSLEGDMLRILGSADR